MPRLGKILRNDGVFFYASFCLLILLMILARVAFDDYRQYSQINRQQVSHLLAAENFPQRRESRAVVVDALLQVLLQSSPYDRAIAPSRERVLALEDDLHTAYQDLWTMARVRSDTRPSCGDTLIGANVLRDVVSSVYQRFDHSMNPSRGSQWCRVVEERIQHIMTSDSCAKSLVVEQGPARGSNDQRLPPLVRYYGRASEDAPGTTHFTSLQIPPLARRDPSAPLNLASGDGERANTSGPSACSTHSSAAHYSDRLLEGNLVGLLLEDIVRACHDSLRGRADSTERIVQAYFMTPEGLLRYWDIDDRKASEAFPHVSSWTVSPFVQEALEFISKSDIHGADMDQAVVIAHLAQRLEIPYIDYGRRGLVRTRTTPLLTKEGRLVGSFCTDVTVDIDSLLPPQESGSAIQRWRRAARGAEREWLRETPPVKPEEFLFGWYLVSFSDEAGGNLQPIRCGGSPGPWERQWPWIATAILKRAGIGTGSFYQTVQVINVGHTQNEVLFVIPLDKRGSTHRLLILRPSSPRAPWGSVLSASGLLFGLICIFMLRRAYERSAFPREREATILRDLQAGVINAGTDGIITEGNDRAEELLGCRLPNFGAEHDLADPVLLGDLVEDRVLVCLKTKPRAPLEPQHFNSRSQGEIAAGRRKGLAFPYWAKLRRPRPLGSSLVPEDASTWICFAGSPILGGEKQRDPTQRRSVAVVTEVDLDLVKTLEAGLKLEAAMKLKERLKHEEDLLGGIDPGGSCDPKRPRESVTEEGSS